MKNILFWVLPPFAGALIGYVTNAIAIKMLFRPLKEIRLFGIRLPFTPGILPRERHKLADSIGRMVDRELLTPGVLRERLAKPEVREKMGNAVGAYTGQLLEQPLSRWVTNQPGAPVQTNGGRELSSGDFSVGELLKGFINSDVFNSFLDELLKAWGAGKAASSGEDESLGFWLKSRVRDLGAMFIPAARDLIKNGLARELKNHAAGEPSSYRIALENIAAKYPGITLGEFLSLGGVKKQRFDSFLTEKAAAAMDKNIEPALLSVDTKALVANRINSMDMIKVEKIILDIMAGQLKWINFFGAVLGALIGFLEALFSFFLR